MPQSVTIVLDTASHQIDVTVEKNSEEEFRDNSMMAVAVQVDSSNKPGVRRSASELPRTQFR